MRYSWKEQQALQSGASLMMQDRSEALVTGGGQGSTGRGAMTPGREEQLIRKGAAGR